MKTIAKKIYLGNRSEAGFPTAAMQLAFYLQCVYHDKDGSGSYWGFSDGSSAYITVDGQLALEDPEEEDESNLS